MSGDELAFWLMMGFSCCIGILVGYILFAPRQAVSRGRDTAEFFEEERFFEDDDEALGPDTDIVAESEPFLTDPRQARELMRRHALERLKENRQRSGARASTEAAAAAASAANAALASKHKPFFEPDTLRTLDAAKRKQAASQRAARPTRTADPARTGPADSAAPAATASTEGAAQPRSAQGEKIT